MTGRDFISKTKTTYNIHHGTTYTTRAQIISYVYDIIDIPEAIRTYLLDEEGIKSVPILASNTDAEWTGIVTRSSGTIKHFQKKYLQDFRDWYREYVNDNEGPQKK